MSIPITLLRVIRKTSYLTGGTFRRAGGLLKRIENKTTRIIIDKTGSADAAGKIPLQLLLNDAIPEITPVHPALPAVHQRPSVTVFAFLDPKGFYGGIATLLCVAASLANELGYDFRVAQTTGFSDKTDVLDFLKKKGITIEESRFSTINLSKRSSYDFGYLPLHPDDVIVVSAWWDAYIASRLPLKRKFLYLIQDYEPIFYNNSDRYVLSDQTYTSEKFIPLLNTQELYRFFSESGYTYIKDTAAWFEPAPAPLRQISKTGTKTRQNHRTLFLYGRPNVHRNLFYNAVKALDIAFQDERLAKDDWALYAAGMDGVPSIQLTSGHVLRNKGKMDIDEYYAFAQNIDIALSPMLAPHPNYPTLELASLGSSVVTTKWRTKQDLSHYSKNIYMADPTPESMAESIIHAATIDDAVRTANIESNKINSNWPQALSKAITDVAKRL